VEEGVMGLSGVTAREAGVVAAAAKEERRWPREK
jgi:hypothetical protein